MLKRNFTVLMKFINTCFDEQRLWAIPPGRLARPTTLDSLSWVDTLLT